MTGPGTMRVLWLLVSRTSASNADAGLARTVLAVLGVSLGVATAMASLTAIVAIQVSLRDAAAATTGRVALEVRARTDEGFPSEAVERARGLPGITAVAPTIEKRTFLRANSLRTFVQLRGGDVAAEEALQRLAVSEGRWPATGEHEVALLHRWARANGLAPGSTLEMVTRDGFQSFTVVGLVEERTPASAAETFGRLAIVSLVTAQESFGMGDRVSRLAVALPPGESTTSVAEALRTILAGPYSVATADALLLEFSSAADQLVLGLAVFGAAALVVGGLLVRNTVEMTVAGQRRYIGLLRAAGALREQVLLIILGQALVVGFIGSVLGIAAGALVSNGLVAWLARGDLLLPGLFSGIFTLPPAAVLLSLALGMSVTLVSALLPAWHASAIAPTEVVRPAPTDRLDGATRDRLWSVVGLPFRWLFGPEGHLAELNLRRAPRRAFLTVFGFAASLSLLVTLALLVASARTAGQERVASLFPGEVLVVSPVVQPPRIADAVLQEVAHAGASLLRPFSVTWGQQVLEAMSVEPDAFARSAALPFVSGDRAVAFQRLSEGRSVLVPARLAQVHRLGLGDRLPLQTPEGTVDFQVVGLLDGSFPSADNLGAIVIARQDAERYFHRDGFTLLALSPAPGQDAQVLAAAARPVAEQYGMEAVSIDTIRLGVEQAVGELLVLFGSLASIGLLVAALGVANTMAVNVAERARELGVLRALGLTRGQVQRMVLAEAAMMGLLGGVLGAVAGLGAGRVLLELARSPDFDPCPVWPVEAVLLGMAGTVLLAMLAAVPPAYVASRVQPGRVLHNL